MLSVFLDIRSVLAAMSLQGAALTNAKCFSYYYINTEVFLDSAK